MTIPEKGDPPSVRSRIEARLEATGLLRPLLCADGDVVPDAGLAPDGSVGGGQQAPGKGVVPGTASIDGGTGAW